MIERVYEIALFKELDRSVMLTNDNCWTTGNDRSEPSPAVRQLLDIRGTLVQVAQGASQQS